MSAVVRSRHSATHESTKGAGPSTPKNPARGKLLTGDELPAWAKDNEYIRSGFRPTSNSYLDCLGSCFCVHNETDNIHSHLLASLWMIALSIYFYPYAKEHYRNTDADDWTVFGLYFLVHDVYYRLDLLGISNVTAGCFPPGLWYTFPCVARQTKMFWISFDLATQVLAAVFVLFIRRFRQPAYRPIRGLLFTFMTLSAIYPTIYACFLHGYRQMDLEARATRYILMIMTYLIAVTIYATRIPEKWRPGWFDLWGQLHQIFHVLMAIGLAVHFSAFAKAFDYTHTMKQC